MYLFIYYMIYKTSLFLFPLGGVHFSLLIYLELPKIQHNSSIYQPAQNWKGRKTDDKTITLDILPTGKKPNKGIGLRIIKHFH